MHHDIYCVYMGPRDWTQTFIRVQQARYPQSHSPAPTMPFIMCLMTEVQDIVDINTEK